VRRLQLKGAEKIMSSAALEWIDAETPHAKVQRSDKTTAPARLSNDLDVRAAVRRIEQFQARLFREAQEGPLVVVGIK
jgi:hypothetical protein